MNNVIAVTFFLLMRSLLVIAAGEGVAASTPWPVIWNADWPVSCPNTTLRATLLALVSATGVRTNAGGAMNGRWIQTLSNPGLWPHFLKNGTGVNGGVPQAGNVDAHRRRLTIDIEAKIEKSFRGAAVVDFEAWSPLWAQGSQDDVYHNASRAAVRSAHPGWSPDKIDAEAQSQFEAGARRFFEATLEVGRAMRPEAQWGFYGPSRFCRTQIGRTVLHSCGLHPHSC